MSSINKFVLGHLIRHYIKLRQNRDIGVKPPTRGLGPPASKESSTSTSLCLYVIATKLYSISFDGYDYYHRCPSFPVILMPLKCPDNGL